MCKRIRYFNIALINDLEDFINVQGMKPIGEDYMKNRQQAKDQFKILNQLAEDEIKENI